MADSTTSEIEVHLQAEHFFSMARSRRMADPTTTSEIEQQYPEHLFYMAPRMALNGCLDLSSQSTTELMDARDREGHERARLRELAFMTKVKARHEVNNHQIWVCFLDCHLRNCGGIWQKVAELAARLERIDRQLHENFKCYWGRMITPPEKAFEVVSRVIFNRQLVGFKASVFYRQLLGFTPRRYVRSAPQPMTRVADLVDLFWLIGSASSRSLLQSLMEQFFRDFISLEQFQSALRLLCYTQFAADHGRILEGYFMNQFVAQSSLQQ